MSFWLLDKAANEIAVIDEKTQRSFTYSSLAKEVDKLKITINDSSKKTLAIILCDNTLSALLGYLALLQSNCATLLLNASIPLELLNEIIQTYEPDWIHLPTSYPFESIEYTYGNTFYHHHLLIRKPNHASSSLDIFPDLALLLPTSGSTSSPKLVRLSYQGIQANADAIMNGLQLTAQQRAITSVPMYHIYGLSVVNSHLAANATILLTNTSVTTKEFWNFATEFKTNSFAGVPYTYQILRKIRFHDLKLDFLKTLTQSGGRIPDDLALYLMDLCKKKNWDFYAMYGQTEAGGRISYVPPAYFEKKWDLLEFQS